MFDNFKINCDAVKYDNLDLEFSVLFDDFNDIIKDVPVFEISPMYFIMCATGFESSLTTLLFDLCGDDHAIDIILNVNKFVNEKRVRVLKPGRAINLSKTLTDAITKVSEEYKNSNRTVYIVSVFHELYKKDSTVNNFFSKYGLKEQDIADFLKEYPDGFEESPEPPAANAEMQVKLEIKNPPKDFNLNNLISNMQAQQGIQLPQMPVEDITKYLSDMVYEVFSNNSSEVFGCDEYISKITSSIMRKDNSNVVIVGESGVGKTSLVEGLVYRIANGTCNPLYYNFISYRLNMDAMMPGTELRGILESRVMKLVEHLKSLAGKIILFIDDFHFMLTDKNFEEFNVSFILKNLCDCDNVKVILTMTQSGYKSFREKCQHISRKFAKINLEKPTTETCMSILNSVKGKYESYHNVVYTEKAISEAIKLSERYIQERSLPSSAIDIIDEAGAKMRSESLACAGLEGKLGEMGGLFREFYNKTKAAKKKEDLEPMRKTIKEKHEVLEKSIKSANTDKKTITEQDIYKVFSKLTGIEYNDISSSEMEKIVNLAPNLKKKVIGQDEAIDKITNAIKRRKAGLIRDNKPILSCMCIGSTGVGKTLLAKMLAKEMFGDETKIVRFDMSEYTDKTSINKLIGASAGYVGYTNGGLLTEAVKNNKYCVLLIDEIEKADPDIYNIFLQIFDEGFMTDNRGERVDFKNTIVLMTSNIGVSSAMNSFTVGFDTDSSSNKRSIIENAYKKKFPPEFINRLDETIYFNDLTKDNMYTIIRMGLNDLSSRLSEMEHDLAYSDDVVEYLFKEAGEKNNYGARPIARLISNLIENEIADKIISDGLYKQTFDIALDNDGALKITANRK